MQAVEAVRQFMHRSAARSGAVLVLLMFVCGSVATLIAQMVVHFGLGIPVLTHPELLNGTDVGAAVPALRMVQLLGGAGLLVAAPLLWLWLRAEPLPTWRGLERQPLLISFALMPVALPLVNWLAGINEGLVFPVAAVHDWMRASEDEAQKLTEAFLHMPTVWHLVFNLLMFGVVPAVGEELIFRRLIQRSLAQRLGNVHVAVWVSAALFSAIHMQFFGFVPRLMLGAGLGYLFAFGGRLAYPVVAHFVNNAMAVVLVYGQADGTIREGIDSTGRDNPLQALFSLTMVMMLLYLMAAWGRLRGSKADKTT
jgi:membrane protease YdiL (CAAX protease family)